MGNTIHYRGEHEYKTYTSEFKTEALALISEQGYSIQEAAAALDITTSQLYSWKNKAEEYANSIVNSDERSELLALRKEVKQLRMEKEILKKASAFYDWLERPTKIIREEGLSMYRRARQLFKRSRGSLGSRQLSKS